VNHPWPPVGTREGFSPPLRGRRGRNACALPPCRALAPWRS
jgi:hypothetical protein